MKRYLVFSHNSAEARDHLDPVAALNTELAMQRVADFRRTSNVLIALATDQLRVTADKLERLSPQQILGYVPGAKTFLTVTLNNSSHVTDLDAVSASGAREAKQLLANLRDGADPMVALTSEQLREFATKLEALSPEDLEAKLKDAQAEEAVFGVNFERTRPQHSGSAL